MAFALSLRKYCSKAWAATFALPVVSNTASCLMGLYRLDGTTQPEPSLSLPFSNTWESATKPSAAFPDETNWKV